MTQTSAHQPPRSGNALDDALDRLRASTLRRDTGNRWFGGVCAGIAVRFGVDPLLIRAAAIALTIAGGLGIPVYLVLWLLLPDADGTVLADRALRHGDAWPVALGIAAAVFVVGGLISIGTGGDGWAGGSVWIVLPVALVVWFLATRSRSQQSAPWPWPGGSTAGATPPPPPPPGGTPMSAPTSSFDAPAAPAGAGTATATAPPAPTTASPTYGAPAYAGPTGPAAPYGGATPGGPYGAGPVPPAPPRPLSPPPPPAPRRRRPSGYVGLVSLGLAIVLFGLGVALEGPLGIAGDPPVLGFAMALAGVAAVVLGLGLTGRGSGFSGFLVLATGFLTLIASVAAHVPTADGFGDRDWRPTTSALPASYSLGAGDATLDLRGISAPADGTSLGGIDASIGAGELTILVPADLTVRVQAHTGAGEIRYDGTTGTGPDRQSGADRSSTIVAGDAGDPDLVVTADLGLGDITIEEQN